MVAAKARSTLATSASTWAAATTGAEAIGGGGGTAQPIAATANAGKNLGRVWGSILGETFQSAEQSASDAAAANVISSKLAVTSGAEAEYTFPPTCSFAGR